MIELCVVVGIYAYIDAAFLYHFCIVFFLRLRIEGNNERYDVAVYMK